LSLTVIYPKLAGSCSRLDGVLTHALADGPHRIIDNMERLGDLSGQHLLFAVPVGKFGINPAYQQLLLALRQDTGLLAGCTAGLIVDGESELYTKSAATELTLAANRSGCAFVGRPLVEGTGSLTNLRVQADNLGCTLEQSYHTAARELVRRLLSFAPPKKERPEVLVLHASSHHISNTLDLWDSVAQRLAGRCTVTEIGLRNGTVFDCSGCPYTMCLHFGEQGGCFYGSVMQDEVYPAVRRADAIVMVCPNYNDAISANLTAFVNRLTALFRQTRFYDKALFAIVVSGYSGGDIVARQLIGGLNMNKSFHLPGNFALIETANAPGEALRLPGIDARLDGFSKTILHALCE